MEEPAPVRRARGADLQDALKEPLDDYAVADLNERIELLQVEIDRVKAALAKKSSGRAAADALFSGLS
ncbi:hypothetical protein BH09PSE2_BH09PSE2_13900 [soil metagenome]